MIAVNRPASMATLTSSSASTSASPAPYARVTPLARAATVVVTGVATDVISCLLSGCPAGTSPPVLIPGRTGGSGHGGGTHDHAEVPDRCRTVPRAVTPTTGVGKPPEVRRKTA